VLQLGLVLFAAPPPEAEQSGLSLLSCPGTRADLPLSPKDVRIFASSAHHTTRLSLKYLIGFGPYVIDLVSGSSCVPPVDFYCRRRARFELPRARRIYAAGSPLKLACSIFLSFALAQSASFSCRFKRFFKQSAPSARCSTHLDGIALAVFFFFFFSAEAMIPRAQLPDILLQRRTGVGPPSLSDPYSVVFRKELGTPSYDDKGLASLFPS